MPSAHPGEYHSVKVITQPISLTRAGIVSGRLDASGAMKRAEFQSLGFDALLMVALELAKKVAHHAVLVDGDEGPRK